MAWIGSFLSGCGSEPPAAESEVTTSQALTNPALAYTEPNADFADGTFAVQSDVVEVRQQTPDANFDGRNPLTIGGTTSSNGGTSQVFLRFTLEGFVSISSVVLEVNVTSGVNNGPKLFLAGDAWSSSTLTYNKKNLVPVESATVADFAFMGTGVKRSSELKSKVTGNGVFSFLLKADTTELLQLSNWGQGPSGPVLRVTGRKNSVNPFSGTIGAPVNNGTLQQVTQSSGIAASHQFSNVYYTHNDRATNTQFFAVDGTGKLLGTYTMKTSTGANLSIFDFEEIQVGPGPSLSAAPGNALQSYVYAGEIGDNCHTRPYIAIHRGAEPGVGTAAPPATANVTMQTLYLQYPVQCQGCTHESINSEAFLIDPITGGLFVIEKRCSVPSGTAACYTGADKKSAPDPVGATDGINRVFFAPAPLDFGNTKDNPTQLQQITYIAGGADTGDCNLQAQAANGRVTGAAVSPDGAFVALAFYDRIAFAKAEVRTDLGYTLSSWNWGFVTHMDVTREGVTFDRVPTKTSSLLSYPYFLTMEGTNSKIMRGVVTVP